MVFNIYPSFACLSKVICYNLPDDVLLLCLFICWGFFFSQHTAKEEEKFLLNEALVLFMGLQRPTQIIPLHNTFKIYFQLSMKWKLSQLLKSSGVLWYHLFLWHTHPTCLCICDRLLYRSNRNRSEKPITWTSRNKA